VIAEFIHCERFPVLAIVRGPEPGSTIHFVHTGVLCHIEQSRGKPVKQAMVDRGYRGRNEANGTQIILPKKPLWQIRYTSYSRTLLVGLFDWFSKSTKPEAVFYG
jgi:hypothetical protein